jgi:hypothetical protein
MNFSVANRSQGDYGHEERIENAPVLNQYVSHCPRHHKSDDEGKVLKETL